METTFKKSDSIAKLAQALLAFNIKVGKIKKQANNPFFKSKYATLPDIQDAIEVPLSECGLVLTQLPDGDGLTTLLMHAESGEYIMANSTMHPVKSDPQSMGSAITYQRRYSIGAILNLNIDDDDDGNAASQPTPQEKTADKPYLNKFTTKTSGVLTADWNKVVLKLQSGEVNIDTVKKHFRLSKENEAELLTYQK